MPDIFGDLIDWGRVLKQLELLRLAGQLDDHEKGLTRLLRYRYNWQLRCAVLRAVPELRRPSRELFDVLIGIVADDYCDIETRLLACNAVRGLLGRQRGQDIEADATRRAHEFLRVPQPPVLRKAVERWLVRDTVEQAAGA